MRLQAGYLQFDPNGYIPCKESCTEVMLFISKEAHSMNRENLSEKNSVVSDFTFGVIMTMILIASYIKDKNAFLLMLPFISSDMLTHTRLHLFNYSR